MSKPYAQLRARLTPAALAQAEARAKALLADLALRRDHQGQGACSAFAGAHPEACLWCAAPQGAADCAPAQAP
jgi:hypothetical protein